MNILVTPKAGHLGMLAAGETQYPCALGPAGIRVDKREGDGVTPAGRFAIRRLLYREDRLVPPATGLETRVIRPSDGWCDDPADPAYNRPVELPYPASAEKLWREDHVYDLLVVLGHNDDPVIRDAGSAIFMHIANPEFSATEGCVALARADLEALLVQLGPGDSIEIRTTRTAA